jgi:hypothetical protein
MIAHEADCRPDNHLTHSRISGCGSFWKALGAILRVVLRLYQIMAKIAHTKSATAASNR